MALKCIVKVGSISNLSDARYCAGMGVDMLGFNTEVSATEYVSPQKLNEIRGWVAGPAIVLELYNAKPQAFHELLEQYDFDLLETDLLSAHVLKAIGKSIIVRIEDKHSNELHLLNEIQNKIAFIILSESMKDRLEKLNGKFKLLIASSGNAAQDIELSQTNRIDGIALQGSLETKTGFKDYDQLAEVLEALAID